MDWMQLLREEDEETGDHLIQPQGPQIRPEQGHEDLRTAGVRVRREELTVKRVG